MKGRQLLILLQGLLSLFGYIDANTGPTHGFFVVVNNPLLGRFEEDLYLYAIHTTPLQSLNQVEFEKRGGLVSETVNTGTIPTGSTIFGCFLYAGLPNPYQGKRYGTYDATYTSADGTTTVMISAFVKRPSDILDTRGVYTYTVWPVESGQSQLAPSADNNIGVQWSPGCRSIQWSKGQKRNVNTGPRLNLKTTNDAGVYTIKRGKRGARGWFAQIKVIVASCQMDEYLAVGLVCTARTVGPCVNGGVIKDAEDKCSCPPYYSGNDCSDDVDIPTSRDFILASSGGTTVRCVDLPDGDPQCRGYLFCFGDLYGCKCASGWWGNNCDQPCQKGKWGVGCSQNCQDCNPFFGPVYPGGNSS